MRARRGKNLTYGETIRFHGHNGPFLALGYKLGRFLVKKYRPKSIMDFQITVYAKMVKPFTCLIDGLQCSTAATLGKGNMKTKPSKRENIRILVERANRTFVYQITKNALNICMQADNLESAAQQIFRTQHQRLWKPEYYSAKSE